MEKRDEIRIKNFLKKHNYEVKKQSPSLYGANGEPDILAQKGKIKIAIEVKDFTSGGKVKTQQIYMLNKYKQQGYWVLILDSENKFNKFKQDLENLENSL